MEDRVLRVLRHRPRVQRRHRGHQRLIELHRRIARGLRDRQAFEHLRMQAGQLFAAGRSQAQEGAYDTGTLIGTLEELRGFLGGQKATLVWDGLPAHRSQAMRRWLASQRSWLVVEPLPRLRPPSWTRWRG
jgi:hypothetical protein